MHLPKNLSKALPKTFSETLPAQLPNSPAASSPAPASSPAASSPVASLAARGYQVSAEASSLALAPICALALHFGDRLTRAPDGMPELLIRASLDAGAPLADSLAAPLAAPLASSPLASSPLAAPTASPALATMHWTLQKSDLRFARGERIRLKLEIDLFLGHDTHLDNLRLDLAAASANLARLVGDARALLSRLVIDKIHEGHRGPVLRLESRFIGDLFTGRCGLISAGRAPMSFRHQAASLAACDWLKQTILPDLAASLRRQPTQADAAAATPAAATPGAAASGATPAATPGATNAFIPKHAVTKHTATKHTVKHLRTRADLAMAGPHR